MSHKHLGNYEYRVHYADTDAFGVIYHAHYLTIAERARMETFRNIGIDICAMGKKYDVYFVVREIKAHYLKPGRLDDILSVKTYFKSMRGASLVLDQEIVCQEQKLYTQEVVLVAINGQMKPVRLPRELAHFFQA